MLRGKPSGSKGEALRPETDARKGWEMPGCHFSKTHMPSSIVEYDVKLGEDVINNTRAACIGHLNLFLQICRRGLGPRPHRTAGCDLILENA